MNPLFVICLPTFYIFTACFSLLQFQVVMTLLAQAVIRAKKVALLQPALPGACAPAAAKNCCSTTLRLGTPPMMLSLSYIPPDYYTSSLGPPPTLLAHDDPGIVHACHSPAVHGRPLCAGLWRTTQVHSSAHPRDSGEWARGRGLGCRRRARGPRVGV